MLQNMLDEHQNWGADKHYRSSDSTRFPQTNIIHPHSSKCRLRSPYTLPPSTFQILAQIAAPQRKISQVGCTSPARRLVSNGASLKNVFHFAFFDSVGRKNDSFMRSLWLFSDVVIPVHAD